MTEPIKITRAEAETRAKDRIMKSYPLEIWRDAELEDFITEAYGGYKIIQ